MAYDVARQRTVLFGGGGAPLADTWEWDGSNWTLRSPTSRPPARRSHAMTYDVTRQRTVLFGGYDGTRGLSDTWEWDGSNWTLRSPPSSPTARSNFAMAYDATRQRVVLFGGLDSSGHVADTWEWDGSNWAQRSPASSPPARFEHALAYDGARQRVVLFGGRFLFGPYYSDTWEWDGSNWTLRSPSTSPGARSGHAMAYDAARQRVVLFGPSGDTWFLGNLARAATQTIGNACPGSNGPPVLTSNDPYLGNPGFGLDLLSARPSSACMFGLSAGTRTVPIGPCTLHLLDPIVPMFAISNWAGFAEAPRFALPLDVALRGAAAYAQAFVGDPQGPVFGLAFSAGLRLTLGD
jgi:hypothetical protein